MRRAERSSVAMFRRGVALLTLVASALLAAVTVEAQQAATAGPAQAREQLPPVTLRQLNESAELVLIRGTSRLVDHPIALQRVSIANPTIADAVVVSANEIVVNGKAPGKTTLLLWDQNGGRTMYQVHVTIDAEAIQQQLQRLMPSAALQAIASGNSLILSGAVHDPGVEERAVSIATLLAGETPVLNQIHVADRGQIHLKVRFAEVNRTALDEWGLEAGSVNKGDFAGAIGTGQFFTPPDENSSPTTLIETSQDAVNFFLFHRPSQVQLFLRALQGRGMLKSLAEPNLMAVPGSEASFLAGGEFPFPVLQGGGANNAVTIQFKEFGIRLNFVPNITNSGAIRIEVAPEVSQLDFSQGLEVSGFRIPALLTRRAETVIELSSGQTFAIAGLVDNTMSEQINKVPLLGDIPILGALFRSEEMRQNRSELLVLVTVNIVRPTDGPPPPVPTGEPETWEGVKDFMRDIQEEKAARESGESGDEDATEGGVGEPVGDGNSANS